MGLSDFGRQIQESILGTSQKQRDEKRNTYLANLNQGMDDLVTEVRKGQGKGILK